MPVSEQLRGALDDFTGALIISISNESEFGLCKTLAVQMADMEGLAVALQTNIPVHEPSFTLVGTAGDTERTLFIYCCPEQSQVRQRMIYSSAKQSLLQYLAERVPVAAQMKRLEVCGVDELTAEFLADELGAGATNNSTSNSNSSHGFIKKLAAPGGRRPGGRK
jgi:hypothetical protein